MNKVQLRDVQSAKLNLLPKSTAAIAAVKLPPVLKDQPQWKGLSRQQAKPPQGGKRKAKMNTSHGLCVVDDEEECDPEHMNMGDIMAAIVDQAMDELFEQVRSSEAYLAYLEDEDFDPWDD